MEDVDSFNISRVDEGKESEQGKVGLDVTAVITYQNTFVVNGQPMTAPLALV